MFWTVRKESRAPNFQRSTFCFPYPNPASGKDLSSPPELLVLPCTLRSAPPDPGETGGRGQCTATFCPTSLLAHFPSSLTVPCSSRCSCSAVTHTQVALPLAASLPHYGLCRGCSPLGVPCSPCSGVTHQQLGPVARAANNIPLLHGPLAPLSPQTCYSPSRMASPMSRCGSAAPHSCLSSFIIYGQRQHRRTLPH